MSIFLYKKYRGDKYVFFVFVMLLLILLILKLPRFQFQQQNVGSNHEIILMTAATFDDHILVFF